MKLTWLIVVETALVLGTVALADEPKKPEPASKKAEPSAPAAEQLKALRKEVDEAHAAYIKAATAYKEGDPEDKVDKLWEAYTKKADENNSKIVELARKDPKATASFEALEWIVTESNRNGTRPYGKEAVELLQDHHADNSKIGRVCGFLGWYSGEWNSDPALGLLKAVADKNPDRAARGQALFSLAQIAQGKAQLLEYTGKGDPEPAFQEAEKAFQRVVKDYADCPNLRRGKGKLGEEAEPQLFEIRRLRIGKEAPEIKGEDLDGKLLKLSDYRGKVVVLDFWGHW